MNSRFRAAGWVWAALAVVGCDPEVPALGSISGGCIAQVTATYDFVVLAQRTDQTLWVAPNAPDFMRIEGPGGPLLVTDSAASGSSAYGAAIGCGVASGGVWCFPLAGALIDSTHLGAGLGAVTTDSAKQVVTALGDGAEPLSGVTQIAGGMNGGGATFCAVTSDGKAWCWGYSPNGLLIQGDEASYARPVLLDATTEFSEAAEVRVGFDSACARRRDGSVWCWGNNDYGQLGTPPASETDGSLYPVRVALPGNAVRIAASPGNTQCVILDDTRVVCWGRNEYAQAGLPSEQPIAVPSVVQTQAGGPDFSAVVDLAPDRGMRSMCANTKNAGLWCWGDVLADDPSGVGSPYPIQLASSPQGRISAPLSAYGARDGKLIYVNANGRLVFGAGNPASTRQPPCPE